MGEEPNHTTARELIQYSLVLPYWTKRIEDEKVGQVVIVLHIQIFNYVVLCTEETSSTLKYRKTQGNAPIPTPSSLALSAEAQTT